MPSFFLRRPELAEGIKKDQKIKASTKTNVKI
jgi:hypothetical protein